MTIEKLINDVNSGKFSLAAPTEGLSDVPDHIYLAHKMALLVPLRKSRDKKQCHNNVSEKWRIQTSPKAFDF